MNSTTVAITGTEHGTTIVHRMRHGPAPSTRAASSMSAGRLRKKFISSSTLNTGTEPAKISAAKLSMRLYFCIVMYHGIVPPLNSMQKTSTHIRIVLGLYSCEVLESGYAIMMMTTIVQIVPSTTRPTEIINEFQNVPSPIISS